MAGGVANLITKLGILIGGNDASAANPVPVRGSSGSALIDLATDVVVQAIRDRLPATLISSRLDVNIGAIAAALAAGANVIGKVGLQVGGVDVSASNPVQVMTANNSQGKKFGSSTTGPWLVYDGPCTLFQADVVNEYASTANLILIDSPTPPTATTKSIDDATGVIGIVQAATGGTATRPYASGKKVTNKLWAVFSSSLTTITFMHASNDTARAIIDIRA